jgi:Phage-related minor tail protein/Peptidase_C39 like family
VAVRRVVAAIDVVINGQRNLDRLAQGYLAVERATINAINNINRMATATTTSSRAMTGMAQALRNTGTAFNSMVNSVVKGREALDTHSKSTRGLTDNILSLTKSMVLFSVLLPLVQLPQRAIESLSEFVKVGAEWQDQMRVANTLLRQNEQQFEATNVAVQKLSIQYNVSTQSMRELFTTAASSVSAIKVNTQALNDMGQAAYDASVAVKLVEGSARLAYATGTDAAEATTTLIQTMATYGLEIEHVAEVSDSLFAITDVGTIRFNQLEQVLPRVTAAMGPLIQQYDTAEGKMKVMNESFAAFAAMTQVMPAEQAATSFANIFKDVGSMSAEQQRLVSSWERIRKTQGLGEELSLDPTAIMKNGPMGALTQLRNVFDLHGKMVDQYVANQRKLGNAQPEEALRGTGQQQLLQQYFGDLRAVRGFQLITPELLQRASTAYYGGLQGATGQGVAEMDKSFKAVQGKLETAWTAMQTSLFKSIEKPLVAGVNPIVEMFNNLLDNNIFQNASFFGKIRIIANSLMDSFTAYYRGPGRAEIQSVGRDIGVFIGDAITSFFRGGKDNVLVEAGAAFSAAFISGIQQTFPDMLKAMLTSVITRDVIEAIAIRYVTKGRIPDNASRALALGVPAITTAVSQGTEGGGFGNEGGPGVDLASLALPAAGAVVTSVAAAAALKRFGGAPIFGKTGIPSNVGGLRSVKDIFEWISLNAGMRAGAARVRPPIAAPTGFGGLLKGIGGKTGLVGAGVQAAMTIPELLSDESEREKWGAVGSTAGSIGGGILGAGVGAAVSGGLLSFILGAGGGILGGGLGRAAGTGLYDITHPGTGKAGEPMTVADAGAPERTAISQIFSQGVDDSLATSLLTQIRDILAHGNVNATVSGGPPVRAAGSAQSPAAATGGGTGLGSSFVNQLDTQQLTPQQAQAACGPAAAAFFARAYGRNPTLKEAYALVTQIQGGDPAAAGVGGTRGVQTIGTALTKLGVGNEVYTGKDVDWGKLANNAQAGIPGVVNIGPRGKFPGHFFQVGGWDPATNRFNVGVSGTVVSKWGGKEWMTPQEMMAMGPVMGAVYGTGAPGGGTGSGPGGAPVTEADIASMQKVAGTGTGPGAAGGGTTITIQNLMNVERMDGNTDIRSLLGQMADMLTKLSTGGSVVGQTGSVTP